MVSLNYRLLSDEDIPHMEKMCEETEIQKVELLVGAKNRGQPLSDVFRALVMANEKNKPLQSYCLVLGKKVIGYLCTYETGEQTTLGIGGWIAKPHRNQGYFKKGLMLLIEGIRKEKNISYSFIASTRPDNIFSAKALENIGFKEKPQIDDKKHFILT